MTSRKKNNEMKPTNNQLIYKDLKLSIGAVCFAQPVVSHDEYSQSQVRAVPCTAAHLTFGNKCLNCGWQGNSAGWRLTHHIGEERLKLLQLVRDGKPLPKPLFLVGQSSGTGFRRITPDEINWETSMLKKSKEISE